MDWISLAENLFVHSTSTLFSEQDLHIQEWESIFFVSLFNGWLYPRPAVNSKIITINSFKNKRC
jgi:hypothetical protein